jgi:short-subunit dehydrogenase
MERKLALITGASSGLGTHFARLFARDGHDVILVARRADRLEGLAAEIQKAHSVTAHVLPADLGDPAAPQRLFDEAGRRGLQVEFLVNNAGFGSSGAFLDLDLAREADHEMRGSGVTVTCHCPGPTHTEFASRAGIDAALLFRRPRVGAAEEVARHAYRAMMKGRVLAIHGLLNLFGMESERLAPRAAVRRITAALNRP